MPDDKERGKEDKGVPRERDLDVGGEGEQRKAVCGDDATAFRVETRVRRNRTSGSLNPYGFEVRNPNHRISVPLVCARVWCRDGGGCGVVFCPIGVLIARRFEARL